ncbi:MAG: nuclear transport factor 2 family protein [Alphaproteobacteria bacterium]
MSDRRAEIVADKHEIETLQRLYAKATDKLGMESADIREEGRKIYHRIFTPDAQVRTANTGDDFVADGPDGWAEVAESALKDYIGTQHLIGTQLTDVDGDQGEMESYLNAWHKNPDNSVYYFLGTYISKVRRYEEGWKIYDMTLRLDTSGIVQTT